METKSLLIGIISFISGALLVSVAATTFEKPQPSSDSMSSMIQTLQNKSGDQFDEEFISQMIVHHEGAVEMAKLSKDKAKHEEIKKLSDVIITAQEHEISQMREWQRNWGYDSEPAKSHPAH